jgi:hypothetical protein
MMFFLNWLYAIVASVIGVGLVIYIEHRDTDVSWGSATASRHFSTAWAAILRLYSSVRDISHVKNFRPNFLVMVEDPTTRPPLVRFVHTLRRGKGLTILGHVQVGDFSEQIRAGYDLKPETWYYFDDPLVKGDKDQIRFAFDSVVAPSVRVGSQNLLQLSGLGRMRPNTFVCGFKEDWRTASDEEVESYVGMVRDAFDFGHGVVLARNLDKVVTFFFLLIRHVLTILSLGLAK